MLDSIDPEINQQLNFVRNKVAHFLLQQGFITSVVFIASSPYAIGYILTFVPLPSILWLKSLLGFWVFLLGLTVFCIGAVWISFYPRLVLESHASESEKTKKLIVHKIVCISFCICAATGWGTYIWHETAIAYTEWREEVNESHKVYSNDEKLRDSLKRDAAHFHTRISEIILFVMGMFGTGVLVSVPLFDPSVLCKLIITENK